MQLATFADQGVRAVRDKDADVRNFVFDERWSQTVQLSRMSNTDLPIQTDYPIAPINYLMYIVAALPHGSSERSWGSASNISKISQVPLCFRRLIQAEASGTFFVLHVIRVAERALQ
jgi:hypothetical protein